MVEIDYETEMVGTTEVPERDRLDEGALTAWMEANVEGFAGPPTLSKFKGGQSNPTYRVDTPGASYVLRRQPFGKLLPSAHAVDREYKAMAALGPTGFPVPKTYGLCEDPEVIGSKFFVMGLADGRSLWNGALPRSTPAERRAIYHSMIDTIADLHLKDPAAIGLSDFGKPTDYCARQIARWTKQYKLSETEPMPQMERLIEWLPQTIPPQHESSVVHGDYRLDNLVFAHDEPRLIAVLDWELSTLGDPIADFAYHCMAWHLQAPFRGLADLDAQGLAAQSLPNEADYLRAYCERRGVPPVPAAHWNFYMAFNLFRAAGIAQGIMGRALAGNASSPHALEAGRQARQLAELGWQQVRRAAAG